jgi:hypothetical protein
MSKADWGNVLGIVIMAACLVLSIWLGVRKNRPVLGAVLGFFLTFIGVVIMLLVPRKDKTYVPQGPPPGYYDPPKNIGYGSDFRYYPKP